MKKKKFDKIIKTFACEFINASKFSVKFS